MSLGMATFLKSPFHSLKALLHCTYPRNIDSRARGSSYCMSFIGKINHHLERKTSTRARLSAMPIDMWCGVVSASSARKATRLHTYPALVSASAQNCLLIPWRAGHHGTYKIDQGAIESLDNTIVLQCVRTSQLMISTNFVQGRHKRSRKSINHHDLYAALWCNDHGVWRQDWQTNRSSGGLRTFRALDILRTSLSARRWKWQSTSHHL